MVVAVLLALGGCGVGDDRGYEHSAARAVGAALSETRTTEQAVRAYLAGDLPSTYASTVVLASDAAIGPAAESFASADPPTRRHDALRARVLDELSDAQDAVATARTGLARDDRAGLRSALDLLTTAGETLERDEEVLR